MCFRVHVRNFALQSRLFIIVLQVLFNSLIPDHDAKVFNPPPSVTPNIADDLVSIIIGGFRRWDAVYFLHIAEHGYTYENTLAFFPLFPLIVRGVANSILFPLQCCMSYASTLLVSAVIVNVTCFVLSAMTLYELGRLVTGNDALAFRAAQFYCINPASVFFSAAYSESCYALLAFRGMLMLERNCWTMSAMFFALSGAARSNGLVNVGFLLHRTVRDLTAWASLYVRAKAHVSLPVFAIKFCRLGVLLSLCAVPFAAFQYHAYKIYCNLEASYADLPDHVRQYGTKLGYRMPYLGLSAWCYRWPPLSYSYIQSAHWHVGFLQYYELKQIPNFLLAIPMATLCMCMIALYIRRHKSHCLYAGLLPRSDVQHVTTSQHHVLPESCFVYVVHTAFLLLFGLAYMHVQLYSVDWQVITRFLASSCPVIYWFAATVTLPRQHTGSDSAQKPATTAASATDADDSGSRQLIDNSDFLLCHNSCPSQAVLIYFVAYVFIGVAAFVNFLPWT